MSQLINDSLYRAGSPNILELYGTYASKAEGVTAVQAGVYKTVPAGLRFGVALLDGFEEYLFPGPAKARANITGSDFIKIFPVDEATQSLAGLMSSADKVKIDTLVEVIQSGGWNVDLNFQVGNLASGNNEVIPEGLETRLTRIEAILGDLYDNEDTSGASDGHFEISQ